MVAELIVPADRLPHEMNNALEHVPDGEIEPNICAAIRTGEYGRVTLSDAAMLLSVADHPLDADAIRHEFLDRLLIDLCTTVTDVTELAERTRLPTTPDRLEQQLTGNKAMTVSEYVEISEAVAIS